MPEDPSKSLIEYGVIGSVLVILLGLFTKFLIAVFGDHGAREKRLSDRIANLEAFVNATLIEVIKHDSEVMQQCVKALEENMKAYEEFAKVSQALLSSISFRPCLLPEGHPAKVDAAKKQLVRLEENNHG